ncbi:hypothetical protein [Sporolactobacillus laevolacticus]|uniref:Uncharacterized protein n=1 Tax=Sporolactobacillus laevolacticus DSM 442 TaxID=1395513 RepID=V6IXD7_9BACL|nr:hypothetical protein [Sporolactobacillus laevolacticus]EST12048.1 hypothetical protein P343_07955 [Sporolactobacillus laevolacticus DSM 442]
MGVKIKDQGKIKDLIRAFDKDHKIKVGYVGSKSDQTHSGTDISIADLAEIHEFGCKIPVSDKMRKYLASQGLYLKASTQYINIPERSFIRSGWDNSEDEVMDKLEELIGELVQKRIPINILLDMIGLEAKGKLQQYARDVGNPPNHPFTVDQKGSSNPLVDTGEMIGAMDYEVD